MFTQFYWTTCEPNNSYILTWMQVNLPEQSCDISIFLSRRVYLRPWLSGLIMDPLWRLIQMNSTGSGKLRLFSSVFQTTWD